LDTVFMFVYFGAPLLEDTFDGEGP
jgi:hypothetical protein